MPLKLYKKKIEYTYTFGTFPTIELLKNKPEKVKTILIDPKALMEPGINELKSLCNKNGIRFDLSPKAIEKLAIKEKTQCIGVFYKYTSHLNEGNHVVLVNPADMGNIGSVIRSMVGFEVPNLAIIKPGVDVFDPKVIRSSMGSIFKINFEYFDSFDAYIKKYNKNNIYPFMLNGRRNLKGFKFNSPFTLVFGNEGNGLDKSFNKYTDTIKIEHSNDIESLNLASSVSIALFNI